MPPCLEVSFWWQFCVQRWHQKTFSHEKRWTTDSMFWNTTQIWSRSIGRVGETLWTWLANWYKCRHQRRSSRLPTTSSCSRLVTSQQPNWKSRFASIILPFIPWKFCLDRAYKSDWYAVQWHCASPFHLTDKALYLFGFVRYFIQLVQTHWILSGGIRLSCLHPPPGKLLYKCHLCRCLTSLWL